MDQGDTMKEFLKKYGKWLLLALLVFIIVVVTHEMVKDRLHGFDTAIYNAVISLKSPFFTEFFKIITTFASVPFLIALSVALFFIFKNKKYGLLSFMNLVLVTLVNQILKFIFSRPRPFEWMLIEETGYSFPSGHAMVSMGFYGMLIFLIWKTDISNRAKKIWTVILGILIFLIGLSRIYLGVHYASDIIAGFALSLSYLIMATAIITYYLKCKANVKNGKK